MFVILGDLIDSRKIANRYEVQEKLQECLDLVNKKYDQYIKSKFSLTLGDEFQGIVTDARKIIEIVEYIHYVAVEIPIRIAIGYGEIRTRVFSETPLMSDGPAWHDARWCIEEMRDVKDNRTQYESKFSSRELMPSYVGIINSNLLLVSKIKSKWKKNHKKMIAYLFTKYGLESNFTQYKEAEVFDLKPQNFNALLSRLGFYDYIEVLRRINDFIDDVTNN